MRHAENSLLDELDGYLQAIVGGRPDQGLRVECASSTDVGPVAELARERARAAGLALVSIDAGRTTRPEGLARALSGVLSQAALSDPLSFGSEDAGCAPAVLVIRSAQLLPTESLLYLLHVMKHVSVCGLPLAVVTTSPRAAKLGVRCYRHYGDSEMMWRSHQFDGQMPALPAPGDLTLAS